MSTDATPPLVIAVEPDSGTRGLFHLILHPLKLRLLMADALDSGEIQQVLADMERDVRRNGDRTAPLPGGEKKVLFINGNLLADCDPSELERLQRCRGAAPIFAVLEPGIDARPVPAGFHLDGQLSKPLKPLALLAAVAGKEDGMSHQNPIAGIVAPTQGSASGEGVLEGFQALIAEMNMNRSMIDELTLSFISRGEEYLEHLGGALDDWDVPGLDRISHSMKGMSGNLRFSEMTALCERLNLAASDGNRESGTEIYKELENEYNRIRAAIKGRWRTPD